jgi:hypothetical protein
MLLTFLVPVARKGVLLGEMKEIVSNITQIDYPLGKIEIVFVIANSDGRPEAKVDGPPLVRVLNLKAGFVGALNISMPRVLGGIVIFADLKTKFKTNSAKEILKAKNGLVLGDNWVAIFKQQNLVFPSDLFCIRTFLLMRSMWWKLKIIGNWGTLSRREILRALYNLEDLYFAEKLKLTWHFLKGKT